MSLLTDAVNITRAEYNETAQTLTIEATSSDELTSPLLTAFGLGDLNNGSRTFTNVLAPPATITVTSAAGGSDSESVTVVSGTGNGENRPPVAVDDAATTPEDTAVTIPVLANDSDEDSDVLFVSTVTPPANGTAVINPENTGVIYTPNLNFNGTDSFSYTVSDGRGGTASATVTITVTAVNDPPVAVNDTATTAAGTAVIISVLANDSDVDSVTRTVSAVTQPTNGVVVINAGNTGVTYTPNADFSGTDTFTYTVSDGQGGSAQALVTVTVTSDGAIDAITVTRAEVRVAQNRWRIRGTGAAPNSTITVHLGPTLSGVIIGVRNADQNGNWVVDTRGIPPGDPPTTISAESSGGSQVLNVPVERR